MSPSSAFHSGGPCSDIRTGPAPESWLEVGRVDMAEDRDWTSPVPLSADDGRTVWEVAGRVSTGRRETTIRLHSEPRARSTAAAGSLHAHPAG